MIRLARREWPAPRSSEGSFQQPEALGDQKVRAYSTKYGAGDDHFGVKHGDIRALAKIKTNHGLALSLWET